MNPLHRAALLLLNFESVLTAVLAWLVFRENADRRTVLGMLLFVLAQRGLGAARTGGYFSIAPFVGAAMAVLVFGEPTGGVIWVAAALMAVGVWLHLTEHHAHSHTHVVLAHAHRHTHDAHHQHAHDFAWDGVAPHTHPHPHPHAPLQHSHAHFPDIHHRHGH